MKLPLYPAAPQALVAGITATAPSPACNCCPLHSNAHSVCVPPEARTEGIGGVLILLDAVGSQEDGLNRPALGFTGDFVRRLTDTFIPPHIPVTLDTALRCTPGKAEISTEWIDACRVHTAWTIEQVRPSKIITLGIFAAESVMGRKPPLHAVRRGLGWYLDPMEYPELKGWVPVHFLPSPYGLLRNRFLVQNFGEDFQAACEFVPTEDDIAFATATTVLVDSKEIAVSMCLQLLDFDEVIAFDTETSGVMFDPDFRIETITFMQRGKTAVIATWDRAGIETPRVLEPLLRLLNAPHIRLVGHNLKYDVLALLCDPLFRVDVTEKMHSDTRLLRKLAEGSVPAGLDVAAEVVGMGGHKAESRAVLSDIKRGLSRLANEPHLPPTKTGKPRKTFVPQYAVGVPRTVLEEIHTGYAEPITYAYRYMPSDVRIRYNARDTYSTDLLDVKLAAQVAGDEALNRLWTEVTHPAMKATVRMERMGVRVDRGMLSTFSAYLEMRLKEVQNTLDKYPGVNFNSSQQLAALLFGKLGLPMEKLTATGKPSTDASALEGLAGKHPIIDALLNFRTYTKMQGTYASGLVLHIRSDGRVHGSLLLDGADTGRTSYTDPNLQNIPSPDRDGETGKLGVMARNCFGARNGYLLLETDYRQIELVEAANNSNDPTMVAMFLSGRDFHDQTAELLAPYIWKISPEEYAKLSKEDRKAKRRVAKTTNFAIHYGTEPEYNLARELDTTIAEARRVVEAVTGVFPVLKARMAEVLERARKEGGIRIRWQGKPANWRNLPGLGETSDSMRGIRRNAENAAWNGIIQGSAGHFATASLYPLQQAFDDLGIDAEVLFPVHDSIMVEVAEKHLRDAALVTRQVMTSWKSGAVPLSVDQKYGTHWGSMAALE